MTFCVTVTGQIEPESGTDGQMGARQMERGRWWGLDSEGQTNGARQIERARQMGAKQREGQTNGGYADSGPDKWGLSGSGMASSYCPMPWASRLNVRATSRDLEGFASQQLYSLSCVKISIQNTLG